VSGICGTIGECRTAQHTGYVRFANAAKRAPPQATDTDLDALVDELLGRSDPHYDFSSCDAV
jgi:hypothetical protein